MKAAPNVFGAAFFFADHASGQYQTIFPDAFSV